MNKTAMQDEATTSGRGADHSGAKLVTVVLTPGRSGSSLLLEVLGNLGLGLSEDLIAGRLENPHGFVEDANVVEVHRRLLGELGARAGMPLPERWLDQQVTREAKRELTDLVRRQAGACEGGWVVKDPRISELLPLWLQVLNSAGVTPRFILALRDPAAVATSLRRSINRDERLTELQWLYRTTQALYHSAADCFVVHYEDWFDRPGALATGLAQYCGLSEITEEQGRYAVEKAIEQRLDRSGWQEYCVGHPLVRRLYAALRDCRGADFDRAALLEMVRECHQLIDAFSGWSTMQSGADAQATPKAAGTQAAAKDNRELDRCRQEVEDLKGHLQQHVSTHHAMLRELKQRNDEVTALRSRLFGDLREAGPVSRPPAGGKGGHSIPKSAPKRSGGAGGAGPAAPAGNRPDLKKSVRYRAGDVLVEAFSNPGRNMLRMPRELWRLAREARRRGPVSKGTRQAGMTTAERTVRESVRYRIGEVLEAAVRRPGKNTLAVPVRLVRLLREGKQRRRTRGQG